MWVSGDNFVSSLNEMRCRTSREDTSYIILQSCSRRNCQSCLRVTWRVCVTVMANNMGSKNSWNRPLHLSDKVLLDTLSTRTVMRDVAVLYLRWLLLNEVRSLKLDGRRFLKSIKTRYCLYLWPCSPPAAEYALTVACQFWQPISPMGVPFE